MACAWEPCTACATLHASDLGRRWASGSSDYTVTAKLALQEPVSPVSMAWMPGSSTMLAVELGPPTTRAPHIVVFDRAHSQQGLLHMGPPGTETLAWAWAYDVSCINAVVRLPSGRIGYCKRILAHPLASVQHAGFLPFPPELNAASHFALPHGADILVCFEHFGRVCAVHCFDLDSVDTVLTIWRHEFIGWASRPRQDPAMLLGLGSLAFSVPSEVQGMSSQVVLLGMQPSNWRVQLAMHAYRSEPHKALSPCTRFLAVWTGRELHLLSAVSGKSIANWSLTQLIFKAQHCPLPKHVGPLRWALDGWQLWLRDAQADDPGRGWDRCGRILHFALASNL